MSQYHNHNQNQNQNKNRFPSNIHNHTGQPKNNYKNYNNQNDNRNDNRNTERDTRRNTEHQPKETKMESVGQPITGISIAGNILAKISFCDKQCSNVNDNKVKLAIVNHLESQYGIQIISRDYNIITPNNLRIVSFHQHILTPLTNGNPYLLFLTKIDDIKCCIYIDRKLKDGYTYPKMHCVKYNFQDELFEKETIFAGELVKDNERRWVFLMDNILLYKGMSTSEKNVISRFELIHNILAREYTQDKFMEICPLQIKKLFLYRDIEKMVDDFIPNLSYVCKGIVFYTLNNRCSNFAFILPRDAQFEVKSPSEIDDIVQVKYPKLWAKKHSILTSDSIPDAIDTANATADISNTAAYTLSTNISLINNLANGIDDIVTIEPGNVVFKILKTEIPDIYNLYCLEYLEGASTNANTTGNITKHSIALVPNLKVSHYLYNTFKSNPNNLNMRVECRYSKIFEKWTPVRFVGNEPFTRSDIEHIEEKIKNER